MTNSILRYSNNRLGVVLLLALLSAVCPSVAQTFKTQAPSSVAQDETFRVEYVLSTTDCDGFHMGQSGDFDVLGGPSTSTYSSTQWVNGKTSHVSSVTYTYVLQARRTGKLALPRPTVKTGGKTLTATAATINVTAAGTGSGGSSRKGYSTPRSSADEDEAADYDLRAAKAVTQKDLYVRCLASKQSLYEQEPVVITYKVYARNGVGLSNLLPRRKPEMKGFWTQEVELPNNLKPVYERIGGVPYRVFTFMQYVAFPQQTGTLTLPALQTDCSIVQRDPNLDPLEAFFNGGGTLTTQLQRSTEPVSFTVRPLPTPRPAGFSGGVGTLSAEGRLLDEAPATNDIATYRITISGQGNMKLIQAPRVSFPKSFDTYDPKTTDDTRITYEGIAGKISFDYTFVPREEGSFTIPATDFIYFDISAGEYRTVHLPATPLNVRKGQRSREDVERELALRQSSIHPDIEVHSTDLWHNLFGSSLWLYPLMLFILGLLTYGLDRLMGASLGQRLRSMWRQSGHQKSRHLAAAEQALQAGDAAAFYTALEQAFAATQVDATAAEDILSRRFAPDAANPDNLKQTMTDAQNLIQVKKEGGVRAILLTLMFMLTALTSLAQTDTVAADSIYNAGNEAFRLKEYGNSVLCYQRVLWINPDHTDARYNLAIVQTRLEDRFAVPQEMFFTTWTRELRTSHSYTTWLGYSVLLFLGMMVLILLFRHTRGRVVQRVIFYAGIAMLVAFIVTNVFAGMQYYDYGHNTQAVIMADEASCYNSPVARGKAAHTLHVGTQVNITDTYGKEWVEVQLPDTRRYWMHRTHLEKVSPWTQQ